MKPAITAYVATVKILVDPRFCNAELVGACDWLSETLRELEPQGLMDWSYVKEFAPMYVPRDYEEGDFLNEHRLEN
jgi:hypothetical protein